MHHFSSPLPLTDHSNVSFQTFLQLVRKLHVMKWIMFNSSAEFNVDWSYFNNESKMHPEQRLASLLSGERNVFHVFLLQPSSSSYLSLQETLEPSRKTLFGFDNLLPIRGKWSERARGFTRTAHRLGGDSIKLLTLVSGFSEIWKIRHFQCKTDILSSYWFSFVKLQAFRVWESLRKKDDKISRIDEDVASSKKFL